MRLFVWIFAFVFLCLAAEAEDSEFREWTSAAGSKVEARLRSFRNGKVELLTRDGRVIRLGTVQLSKADQEFLSTVEEAGEAKDAGAEGNKKWKAGAWYSNSVRKPDFFVCEFELKGKGTFEITLDMKGRENHVVSQDFEKGEELLEAREATGKAIRVYEASEGGGMTGVTGATGAVYPVRGGTLKLVIQNETDVETKGVIWVEPPLRPPVP